MSTRRLLLADWIEESDRLPGLSAPRAVTREVPDDRMLVAGADCDVAVEEGHVGKGPRRHAVLMKAPPCLHQERIPVEGEDDVLRPQAEQQQVVDVGLLGQLQITEVLVDGRVQVLDVPSSSPDECGTPPETPPD